MSLFGSLYANANGMLAQGRSMGFISENIANVTTTGYKRSEARFTDYVTNSGRNTLETASAGGAQANKIQRIDHQGAILQSSSSTDTSVNGNGFFAVRPSDDTSLPFAFTRNGSFNEDASGFLRNSAGFILYGAIAAGTGLNSAPPDVSAGGSLIPVDVTAFDEIAIPTTEMEISMNLNATLSDIDPHALALPVQLPISNLTTPSASRTFTIVDNSGLERDLRFEFFKTVGPMAHFTSNIAVGLEIDDNLIDPGGSTTGILDNDAFSITVGAASETFEIVDTVGSAINPGVNEVLTSRDLINAINAFDGGGVLRATITDGGNLLVQAVDPTVTITVAEEFLTTPLTAANTFNLRTDPGAEDPAPDFTFEPEATLDVASAPYPDQASFPALGDAVTPNPAHWWEVSIVIDQVTGVGTTSAIQVIRGLVNFNGDGSFNIARDAFGNPINATIDIAAPIDFDTTTTGEELAALSIDIGSLSQFDSATDVIFSDHDGAPIGQRTGIEISRDGFVTASYSNGQVLQLYRIPVVTFNNPNGLRHESGTVFYETSDSGVAAFQGAGENGAGGLETSSLEQSNVDIAEEFGNMIVSQRAYGLNSQVIQAVNEMTQTLSQIAR